MIERVLTSLRGWLDPRGTAAFLALSLAVGVVVGLAASALIGSIEGLEHGVSWAQDQVGNDVAVFLVAVPVGLVLAWYIARRFAPEVAGDGVPEASAALAIRSGYLPSRSAPLKVAVTSLTVGLGGSAGREGPIVQIGGAIGSSLSRHTGMGEDRVRSLVAAGAGAAIGASFNAPIAGMLFAMEVILGNFAIRHLNAVVVSSVAAAVTTRSIVGESVLLRAIPHRLEDPRDLILYAVLGVLAALVGVLFLRSLHLVEGAELRVPGWVRPVGFGVVVALIGWWKPEVLGTGEEVVSGLLALADVSREVWWVFLAIAGAKLAATTLTLASGASGGAFMPSLFIGAALGAGFADLMDRVWVSPLQPGSFAVVGMAATFAAVARAPLTSILIVFEITGDYGLVLPLMLAAVLATFLGDRLHPESVYSMALARRGIRLARRSEVDILDTVEVGDVVDEAEVVLTPEMTTARAQELIDDADWHGAAVAIDGELAGVLTVSDIRRTGGPGDSVTVGEAMTPRPITATPSTPVSEVLARMAALGVGRVPIVDEEEPNRLVGLFRREDAVTAYHLALGKEMDHEMRMDRLRARTHPGAAFADLVVPADSPFTGRLLRQVPVPSGCTIVSVRRGTEVHVPDGETVLLVGDVLTVFGRQTSRDQLVERIRVDGDPTGELAEVRQGDDASFFDIEILAGSLADGRPIRKVPLPGGCTLVSIRRGAEVIVPDGDTILAAEDVVTVFGRPGARRQLAERLLATAED